MDSTKIKHHLHHYFLTLPDSSKKKGRSWLEPNVQMCVALRTWYIVKAEFLKSGQTSLIIYKSMNFHVMIVVFLPPPTRIYIPILGAAMVDYAIDNGKVDAVIAVEFPKDEVIQEDSNRDIYR